LIRGRAVDKIQSAIRPLLRERGFKVRGRTFNRRTDDGLTQVVNIQMGPSDPPGASPIPGLLDNLHGLFAINLGVYVPEVARRHGGGEAKSWVQEYHCCVRARLGELVGGGKEIWWHARADDEVIADVRRCLEDDGTMKLFQFSASLLIASITLTLVCGACISDSRREMTAEERTQAMKLTLEWGRLATLPPSASDLTIKVEGGIFTRTFRLSFRAPRRDIDIWIKESPGLMDAGQTYADGKRKYMIKPGGGANRAEVTIGDDDAVEIYASWS